MAGRKRLHYDANNKACRRSLITIGVNQGPQINPGPPVAERKDVEAPAPSFAGKGSRKAGGIK